MIRELSVVVVLCAAVGCSSGSTEPRSNGSPPPTGSEVVSANVFTGSWRSVTPSLEFVRLSVHSKSSEQGALAALLTFSGVAWEGGGRIEGGAFGANMALIHTTEPTRVLTARARDAGTLLGQLRSPTGAPLELTFVRDD